MTEQVNNVLKMKDLSPADRLYLFVTGQFNPALEANFNSMQLNNAPYSPELQSQRKVVKFPDPRLPPSLNRLVFKGNPFTEKNMQKIQQKIEEIREETDLPFDEM